MAAICCLRVINVFERVQYANHIWNTVLPSDYVILGPSNPSPYPRLQEEEKASEKLFFKNFSSHLTLPQPQLHSALVFVPQVAEVIRLLFENNFMSAHCILITSKVNMKSLVSNIIVITSEKPIGLIFNIIFIVDTCKPKISTGLLRHFNVVL